LLLNPAKTEAVFFGTQLNTSQGTDVAGTHIQFADAVKLLGVTLDSTLSFDKHVTDVVRQCYYHIRALKHIRPLLTLEASKIFAVSIVGSKLDYCNCVLDGISQSRPNIDKLQRVQNVLAQVTVQAPWSVSAIDLRLDLHRLPIRQSVIYELYVLTHKALYTGQPYYLADFIQPYIYRLARYDLLTATFLLFLPFLDLLLPIELSVYPRLKIGREREYLFAKNTNTMLSYNTR